MSENQIIVVDLDVGPDEAEELAQKVRSWLLAEQIIIDERGEPPWWENADHPGPQWRTTVDDPVRDPVGIQIATGPRIYSPVENTGIASLCPRCGDRQEFDDWIGTAGPVFDDWMAGSGPDVVPCAACGAQLRLSDWQWVDGEPWAMGHLGLVFWDWPELSPRFLDELRGCLGGHQTRVIFVHM